MPDVEQKVTFFAVNPYDPTGQEIVFGRGNPNNPKSLASEAFASVDTTDPSLGEAVVANLGNAAGGDLINRGNAAEILSKAFRLAQARDLETVDEGIENVKNLAFEVDAEKLEAILQPDEVLAAQSLDRSIQAAEANQDADHEQLVLLRFQRTLVDMSPIDAGFAAKKFVRETGKYATFLKNTGDDIHYPVNRELFVPDLANNERWRIVGIDPTQYDVDPYHRLYRRGIEESWKKARLAKQALSEAQAIEAAAMEQVTNPPAFVPRDAK